MTFNSASLLQLQDGTLTEDHQVTSVVHRGTYDSIQARRTQFRRERDMRNRLRSQIEYGGPQKAVHEYRNENYEREYHQLYQPSSNMVFQDQNNQGIPVTLVLDAYITSVVMRFSRTTPAFSSDVAMYRAIQSFVFAPPVRYAYYTFTKKLEGTEFESISEVRFVEAIEQTMANSNLYLTAACRKGVLLEDNRMISQSSPLTKPPVLVGLIIQFLYEVDSWRCSSAARGRQWNFGSSRLINEFLISILLQFWHMDQEDCFKIEHQNDAPQENRTWGERSEFHPWIHNGDRDDVFSQAQMLGLSQDRIYWILGYIGGVGQCSPGWITGG